MIPAMRFFAQPHQFSQATIVRSGLQLFQSLDLKLIMQAGSQGFADPRHLSQESPAVALAS